MDTRGSKSAGNRRVTIKDVAAALNVAVSTVSNAYNRPDQLSPALRQRVFETAERIGYPGPNPVARGLRRGTSGLIAILLGQPLAAAYADPVTAATLEGITAALAESGRYGLVLVPSEPAGGLPAADGAIALCPDRDDPLLTQVTRHGQPIVLVDHPQRDHLRRSVRRGCARCRLRRATHRLDDLPHQRPAARLPGRSRSRRPQLGQAPGLCRRLRLDRGRPGRRRSGPGR